MVQACASGVCVRVGQCFYPARSGDFPEAAVEGCRFNSCSLSALALHSHLKQVLGFTRACLELEELFAYIREGIFVPDAANFRWNWNSHRNRRWNGFS